MKSLINAAVQKAAELARNQNVLEATRVIQRALAARSGLGPLAEAPSKPPGPVADPVANFPRLGRGVIDQAQPDPACNGMRDSLPLGEVLDLLRHAERPAAARTLLKGPQARPAMVPPGARFTTQTFACAAGARDYKLYVPGGYRERQLPLILMLHGCAQDPDDFALGTGMNRLAEEYGFVVAYPRQSPSANQSACWNWFVVEHQRRDFGEPSILAGMTRAIMAELPIDEERVFVAGLSAGGAMAAVMGATYPELYGAVGIHSGLPYGAASDLMSALAAMRGTPIEAKMKRPEPIMRGPNGALPTIIFHGAADRTVHPSNADRILASAKAGLPKASAETRRGRSAGGRGYARTIVRAEAGQALVEHWTIEGLGHAWSGGAPEGSYTDPLGPDASREMVRFFLGPAADLGD